MQSKGERRKTRLGGGGEKAARGAVEGRGAVGEARAGDESEEALLSVDIAAFLVCARKFICSLAFLFIFVCI